MTQPQPTPEQLFAGDGELVRLARSHDWSQTPLGALETWPDSLKTAAQILLTELAQAQQSEKMQVETEPQQPGNLSSIAVEPAEAAAQLRELETKHHTLFESLDEGFCVCELLFDENGEPTDYRFLEVNAAFERLTGLEQVVGKTARELVPNQDAPWFELFGSVVRARKSVRFEAQESELNRWLNVNAFCIGEPQRHQFAALFTNISETKRIEAERQKVEQERERFLAAGSDLQVIMSSHGYFHWVSPAFERILGWTPAEMTSHPWTDFLHPDDIAASIAESVSVLAGAETFAFENRYRHKDGSYRWLLWRAQSHPDEQVLYATAVDITARKQAEVALRQSEEQYRLVFESIDEGFCTIEVLFDADGKPVDHFILQANPAFERQSGIVNPEGKRASELAPGLEQFWNDLYAQVVHTGKSIRTEVRSDALDRWFDVVASRIGDVATRQVAIVFTDISDRKRIEATLRESEQRFRLMADAAPQIVWITDAQGQMEFFNKQWSNYTGVPYEPTTAAEAVASFVHPDDGKRTMESFDAARRSGGSFSVEHRLRSAAGDYRWFLGRAEPYRDPQTGKIIHWFGASVDIHDRKQAEAAIAQREAQFRQLADAMPQQVWITDAGGNTQYVNQQWATYTGLTLEQTQDIHYATQVIHPDDFEMTSELWRTALTTGTLYQAEFRLKHLSAQTYRWFLSRAIAIRDEQGQIVQWFGTSTDIEALRRAQAQREQLLQQEQIAREAAENANRIKDEFLAVLSHELRSPLNPILGWTQLLLSGKLNPARQMDALATIERNAKLQSQLIEDLLDISRIMQGKLSLTVTSVNLASIIHAAVETVSLAADAKTIQITLDLDPDVAAVSGDAARLQQMVWNLLTNAVKFTDDGGQVMVQLRQVVAEGSLGHGVAQIRVVDTGKGIDPKFLPYVFEYFRQEDGSTTRKFGGLGLGLAIVRQIVDLHGGTVKAESGGEYQGATFIVQLPALQRATSILSEQNQPQSGAEARLDNVQILLVEDDADTREFQSFLLEQHGATVTAVASGIEALQALEQFIPNVIVSDIGMEEMDGYRLMQQIRSRPPAQGGAVPAIALTAYAAEIDQEKALQAGFQTHLTKPLEPERFVREIVTLLKPSRV
ncbi:PAS domain S-box protein [Nodosilinea sp. FACHB-131]|uniref:hybrid sensor histidine kinase/response regulator n=1 Tax=Cyanophyceae TaxID=3028117 RepID=UPI001687223D|nr:PAS domain S-box protein [Nodosilinea sp. FACHB-131]MBD1876436.1 PAS domain S-box protein [Nodosilinea sp. FACHB-131]